MQHVGHFQCWTLSTTWVCTFVRQGLYSTNLKAKAAGSWAVVQQRHSQLQCGNTVNLKVFLLQGILVPSLHYGCALWGMHSARHRKHGLLYNPSVTDTLGTFAESSMLHRVLCCSGIMVVIAAGFLVATDSGVLHQNSCCSCWVAFSHNLA